jgi:ectoine hydroxylase-related dioxygenase (phytanoyl-CoA dioxygenase family)
MAVDRDRPTPGEVPWLESEGARERARATAPDTEIEKHALELIDRGLTVVPGCVSTEACDAAVEAFRSWCGAHPEYAARHRDEHGHYPRVVNLHEESLATLALFSRNKRALAVQDFCFGYRTALYTSLFYERGSAQPIHRDLPYFRTEPNLFYFGMWVALEDVDAQNGPLVYRPGGHRIPEIDPHALAKARLGADVEIPRISMELWVDYQARVESLCAAAALPAETLEVRKGDTVIWHPLTPHGGAPIADLARTRFSIVFHTTPEHVPVYQGEVFFDALAKPSPDPPWAYRGVDDRLVAAFDERARFQGSPSP